MSYKAEGNVHQEIMGSGEDSYYWFPEGVDDEDEMEEYVVSINHLVIGVV